MASKNKQEAKLDMTEDQTRVAEALVFSGVNYERQRLLAILEPHRGQEKSISVDVMIDVINNVAPQQQEQAEEQE